MHGCNDTDRSLRLPRIYHRQTSRSPVHASILRKETETEGGREGGREGAKERGKEREGERSGREREAIRGDMGWLQWQGECIV